MATETRPSRGPALLLALLMALFAASKVPVLSVPYHWDEMGYVATISYYYYETGFYPIAHIESYHDALLRRLSVDSGHPPLFYLVVAALWRLVGVTSVVPRLLVLGLALLCLWATYRMAALALDARFGVLAAACLATNPLFFAQVGTAHLDLPLAGLAMAALFALLAERPVPYLSACTVMLLVKAQAVLFLPTITLVVLARGNRIRRDRGWPSAARYVAAWHLPLVAWVVWKAWFVIDKKTLVTQNAYNVEPFGTPGALLWGMARGAYFGLIHRGSFFFAAAAALGLAGAAWRRARGQAPRQPIPASLLLCLALPIITTIAVQAPLRNNGARYYLVTLPLLIVAGCLGIRQLGASGSGTLALLGAMVVGFQVYAWHGPDPFLVAVQRVGIVDVARFREGGKYWSGKAIVRLGDEDVTASVENPQELLALGRGGSRALLGVARPQEGLIGKRLTVLEQVGAEVKDEYYTFPIFDGRVTATTAAASGGTRLVAEEPASRHAHLVAGTDAPNDSHENNMDYLGVVRLHREALAWLSEKWPGARVLASWPGIFEASYPYLGYVKEPFPVIYLAEAIGTVRAQDFDVLYAPDAAMFPDMHAAVVKELGLVPLTSFGSSAGRVTIYGHPGRTTR